MFAIVLLVIAFAAILPWLVGAKEHIAASVGLGLGLWVISNSFFQLHWSRLRQQLPMLFAHVGIGITVIGLALTTVYSQQNNLSMKPGQQVTVGPYQFKFVGIQAIKGSDYTGYQGIMQVSRGKKALHNLYPQIRNFSVQQTSTSKSAINVGIFRDLYVALGDELPGGAWAVRIYYKPFVRWIWAGGLLMMLGGLIALFSNRWRAKKMSSMKSSSIKQIKLLLPLAIFLVIVVFLWLGLKGDPHVIPSPFIGKPVPVFQAPLLGNPKLKISDKDFKGHVSLLNVFATWCVSCRAEHPVLMDIKDSHRVNIYGLNFKDKRASAIEWLSRFGDPYTKVIYDPTGKIGIDFGVYGTPETFVIDRKGIIRYKYIGPISPRKWREKLLPEVESLEGNRE